MAGALVDAIMKHIAEIATGGVVKGYRWVKMLRGVKKEVERLERNFESIQDVLEDAEQKQTVEKNVECWLDRLKEVSYNMEDVLDEGNTALIRLQINGVGNAPLFKRMVRSFISYFCFYSRVARYRHLAVTIKDINKELDELTKEKDRYQLIKREVKQPRRVESTSLVDVSKLHGREEVKKDIMNKLLCRTSEKGEDIQTISVTGMGGIGKTSLAQLIYNDDEVRTHFHKTSWVCVSDFFDHVKIARAILGGLDQDPTDLHNQNSLGILLVKIREKIRGKKFFFILDDVWTDREEDWEPLITTFRSGMLGSRILVTTRKESVATVMKSSHKFSLERLSDDVCWLILNQITLEGTKNEGDKTFQDIGWKIVKKCQGLPLAAKALGGLLRDKTREEWENVMNSEIWNLNLAHEYIFTTLLLSYYGLPSAIRRCLLHCVIFPKNYEMWIDIDLIPHWMALGYLNSGENSEKELKGDEYFKCLAAHSFFQDFQKDEHGTIY
ncbi:PREDICTED: disease resistance protein RGA2-like [Theobroma cacao]|uniref:Disease resistance protein RGA2-like n=1 Tax=Theobroma cacao TaxID=3641 RepID=A0AB32W8X9_THECC|nr:PREDICTED: disease resistance protein RGA2-like [Theobroma cacao]